MYFLSSRLGFPCIATHLCRNASASLLKMCPLVLLFLGFALSTGRICIRYADYRVSSSSHDALRRDCTGGKKTCRQPALMFESFDTMYPSLDYLNISREKMLLTYVTSSTQPKIGISMVDMLPVVETSSYGLNNISTLRRQRKCATSATVNSFQDQR
jgi:hypothetical protein